MAIAHLAAATAVITRRAVVGSQWLEDAVHVELSWGGWCSAG
jgi:hypothetical protein